MSPMVVEWIAIKTASWMRKIEPERTASVEVLEYGLKIIYNTLAVILLSIISGLFLDNVIDILVSLLSFVLLRLFSGGFHLKSSDYCVLVSTLLIVLISLFPINLTMFYVFNIITIVLLVMLAPRGIQSQIHVSEKYNLLLKIIALVTVLINFYFIKNETVTVSFLVQALTLIPNERKKV